MREGSRIPGKIPVCPSWKYGTPLLRNGDVFHLETLQKIKTRNLAAFSRLS